MLSLEAYSNRWLWFNDGDVRRFDPEHLANECFGGEIVRHLCIYYLKPVSFIAF